MAGRRPVVSKRARAAAARQSRVRLKTSVSRVRENLTHGSMGAGGNQRQSANAARRPGASRLPDRYSRMAERVR